MLHGVSQLVSYGNTSQTKTVKRKSINKAMKEEKDKQDAVFCEVKTAERTLGHIYRFNNKGRQFGDRILVGAKFSAPVQTRPGANPSSCKMGTGSFPG